MQITKTHEYDVTIKAIIRNGQARVEASLTREYGTPPRPVTVTQELSAEDVEAVKEQLEKAVEPMLVRLSELADHAAHEALTVATNRREVI